MKDKCYSLHSDYVSHDYRPNDGQQLYYKCRESVLLILGCFCEVKTFHYKQTV